MLTPTLLFKYHKLSQKFIPCEKGDYRINSLDSETNTHTHTETHV